MVRGLVQDLHTLPKVRDRLSYLYIERARLDQDQHALVAWDSDGQTQIPIAAINVLMLGPGTTITSAAIHNLADNSCLVVWCGEENIRFYAFGTGGTHSAARLLHQAKQAIDPALRLAVCRRMYAIRFEEVPPATHTIEQLRGMEGYRVREAYRKASEETGVEWHGRRYDRKNWSAGDPINQALSAANACLYGICHAAVITAGYSPALGFIHTGTERAFVLDIADLYKVEITIPVAFHTVALSTENVARQARINCRDTFRETKLLERILPDIERVLGKLDEEEQAAEDAVDEDPTAPTPLWTPPGELEEVPDGGGADG